MNNLARAWKKLSDWEGEIHQYQIELFIIKKSFRYAVLAFCSMNLVILSTVSVIVFMVYAGETSPSYSHLQSRDKFVLTRRILTTVQVKSNTLYTKYFLF